MFEFVEDSFNRENSFENILSIQVGLNGFSFCIRKGENNKLLYFKQLAVKISSNHLFIRRVEDWFKEESLLLLPYREKHLYFIGHRFSLVPHQLESEELKSDLRMLLMAAGDEEEYAENWVEEIKAKLVFMLPDGMNKVLRDNLGDIRLKHVTQKLIALSTSESAENSMLLFFDEKKLFLLASKNQQLVLSNLFSINHANDVLYYTLTAAKQLKLDFGKCILQIAGKSDFMESAVNNLSAHCKSIAKLPHLTEDQLSDANICESVCLF